MTDKKKILLIEDDPDQVLMYEVELTKAGYLVFTAKNKAAAFETIKEEHPDLVFLDLLLGPEKGRDILKAIKSDPEIKNTKVVILSNFNQKDLPAMVKKEGALDFMNKSEFIPREVAERAKEYLKIN
ncbi:MAG: response regulator [Patescibacteria group bacterium]|jgi:DNA-binding response OmpR family regulator